MTDQGKTPTASHPIPSRMRGMLSLLALAAAAATAALMAYVHLGIAPDNAMLAASAAFAVAAALQSMIGRSRHVRALEAEIAGLRGAMAGPMPQTAAPAIQTWAATAMSRTSASQPPPALPATGERTDRDRPPAMPPAPATASATNPRPPIEPGIDKPADRSTARAAASLPAERTAITTSGTIEPYWGVRPGAPQGETGAAATKIVPSRPPVQSQTPASSGPTTRPETARHAGQPAAHGGPPRSPQNVAAKPAAPAAPIAPAPLIAATSPAATALHNRWPIVAPSPSGSPLDLNAMQSLVEQLADQLAQPSGPASPDATVSPPRSSRRVPASAVASPPDLIAAPPQAAQTNRQSPLRQPTAPLGKLALLAEAVEAKRMDVLLEPILGLDDRKARHFEMSVRFMAETGEPMQPADYAAEAAGTGLLARIDAAKLDHAAEIAGRLRRRGSHAALFSDIAGESLADDSFLGAFADTLEAEDDISAKLILTFAQADARHFTEAHWHSISVMSDIGLRFALDHVTDLDMDFSRLKRHGFEFIKLDAPVFLSGMPAAGGLIPAADICRHLSGLGLALIVGGIIDERNLGRILGFGALLGQGTLFGGARSVEVDRGRKAA